MALLPTSFPTIFSTPAVYGDQNYTNGTCPQIKAKEWHRTVLPVYILLIAVLGIVFNVFVLIVFCFHKKACTVAEIYLSNMAAADLVLTACLPFWAVYAANKFNWPFTKPLCRLVTLSITMNAYCSIYFLVMISIDRYVALVHPLSRGGIRRTKYAKLGCLLVWGFGLLLSVPTLVYRDVKYFDGPNTHLCFLNYPDITVHLLFNGFLITFSFIIPMIIISYCTLKIIQALNNRPGEGLNTQKKEQTEQKATTLVMAVLLAFMICWVPHHLVQILQTLLKAEVLTGCSLIAALNICSHIFMYFAFFNSILNPILYVIVGKNFQKKCRELFKQWSFNRTMTLSTASVRSTFTSVNTTV